MKMSRISLPDSSLSCSTVMQRLLSVLYVIFLTEWMNTAHARPVRRLCKVSIAFALVFIRAVNVCRLVFFIRFYRLITSSFAGLAR